MRLGVKGAIVLREAVNSRLGQPCAVETVSLCQQEVHIAADGGGVHAQFLCDLHLPVALPEEFQHLDAPKLHLQMPHLID